MHIGGDKVRFLQISSDCDIIFTLRIVGDEMKIHLGTDMEALLEKVSNEDGWTAPAAIAGGDERGNVILIANQPLTITESRIFPGWNPHRNMPDEYTIMDIAKSGNGQRVLEGYTFTENRWEPFCVSIYAPDGRRVYHFNAYSMLEPDFNADPKVADDLRHILFRWKMGWYKPLDLSKCTFLQESSPPPKTSLWRRIKRKLGISK